MAYKETTNKLTELLDEVAKDLEKGTRGNKAATQRVRVGTIVLEKLAKKYRKESIAYERRQKTGKKASTARKASTKKKPAVKAKATKKTAKRTRR